MFEDPVSFLKWDNRLGSRKTVEGLFYGCRTKILRTRRCTWRPPQLPPAGRNSAAPALQPQPAGAHVWSPSGLSYTCESPHTTRAASSLNPHGKTVGDRSAVPPHACPHSLYPPRPLVTPHRPHVRPPPPMGGGGIALHNGSTKTAAVPEQSKKNILRRPVFPVLFCQSDGPPHGGEGGGGTVPAQYANRRSLTQSAQQTPINNTTRIICASTLALKITHGAYSHEAAQAPAGPWALAPPPPIPELLLLLAVDRGFMAKAWRPLRVRAAAYTSDCLPRWGWWGGMRWHGMCGEGGQDQEAGMIPPRPGVLRRARFSTTAETRGGRVGTRACVRAQHASRNHRKRKHHGPEECGNTGPQR